jgi:hypothetical protein
MQKGKKDAKNNEISTTLVFLTKLVHPRSQHRVPISFNAGGSSNFFADEPTAAAAEAMTDSFCVNFVNDDFGVERMDFEKAGATRSAMATRSREDTGIRMISIELRYL